MDEEKTTTVGVHYVLYIAGCNFTTFWFLVYLVGLPLAIGFILGRL